MASLHLLCCFYDCHLYLLCERSEILRKNYNLHWLITLYNAIYSDIERIVFAWKYDRIALSVQPWFQQNTEFPNLERSNLLMPVLIFNRKRCAYPIRVFPLVICASAATVDPHPSFRVALWIPLLNCCVSVCWPFGTHPPNTPWKYQVVGRRVVLCGLPNGT